MRIAYLFGAISISLMLHCRSETSDFDSKNYAEQRAYFPLKIGKRATFQVDSIVFWREPNGQIQRDSSKVLLQEIVADTLRDNAGQLIFKIECYARRSDSNTWEIQAIRTANLTEAEAIRCEDNLSFRKLLFPLDRLSTWDGNAYFDKDLEVNVAGEKIQPFANWNYTVKLLDQPGKVGLFDFDSLLVVREADISNLYERRFSVAEYAKNVGLVYREVWILDSQYCNQIPPPTDCETKPWAEKAEKGFIVRQQIIDFN